MSFKSVILAVFLIHFAKPSFAGNIEVAQWIPWSSLASETQNWPLSLEAQSQNYVLQFQDLKPLAQAVDFSIKGSFQNLQFSKSGIQASAQGVSANVKVGRLSLDQTIVANIGGNQLQLRIKVSCQPFEISIPNFDVSAHAVHRRQGEQWSPALNGLSLNVHEGWSLSPVVCEGPTGIEERITGLIVSALKNPDSVTGILTNYLAVELQNRWVQAWQQMTLEGYKDLKVSSMSDPMDEGFFLKGEISAGTGDWHVPLPSQLSARSQVTTPQLVISSEGFAALARENLSQYSIQNYDLQQVSSFHRLAHSRFLQFFVWSDLWHFSKSTPFLLSTLPDQKIDIQSLGGGKWQVQLQTRGVIRAERSGQVRNYIDWGLGLSTVVTTSVKDSRLILQSNTPQTRANWNYSPEYVSTFHPRSNLSESVLQKATASLFQSKIFEVPLPVLQTRDHVWKLNNWIEDQGLIWMEWH
jgi:hypothetical protein